MKTTERFTHSGNGPRRREEPTGSPLPEQRATGPATRWRGKVFFCAAGILACVLVAVAAVDLAPVLAQAQPEGPAVGDADGDDAGAAQSPGKGSGGFMGGMGTAGTPGGMGGFGGMGGMSSMGSSGGKGAGMGGMGSMGSSGGKGGGMGGFMFGSRSRVAPSARQELEARLAPLLNQLRQAEDDSQKETVKRELSNVLENYFDNDMKRRLSDIASIEQRVRRLRDQYEKRQQAKEQILQLQMKVLENEAAGLGFFGSGSSGAPVESAADSPGRPR